MPKICLAALLAVVSPLSIVAQARVAGSTQAPTGPHVPPYCSPCLFYSGDSDPANRATSGLGNGTALGGIVGTAAVYIPFVVPVGQTWTVRALFVNELAAVEVLDPATAPWSISINVSSGNPGTVVASGNGSSTLTPTGRSFDGYAEFTVMTRVREFQLQPGTYWLSMLPQCTNKANPSCAQEDYFASNVEDVPPPNAKGISPWNDSFLTYAHGGDYYTPTWDYPISCCNRFSAGAIGVATKTGE